MQDLWNRLLIFLHLRLDPERTPPAFPSLPHQYDGDMDGQPLTCCAQCGGGEKHAIHTGYPTPEARAQTRRGSAA